MREAIKYRRENITAPNFMRPPTEVFTAPVVDLARDKETEINEKLAAHTDRRPGILRRMSVPRQPTPGLQMGSEVEIIFFAKDSDPTVDAERPFAENPNYQREHRDAIYDFSQKMLLSPNRGGLGDVIASKTTIGKISLEVRTRPTDVAGYTHAMERLGTWIREEGEGHGFAPVALSQHIHFSATTDQGRANILLDHGVRQHMGAGMIDAARRALPLVRPPEEVNAQHAKRLQPPREGIKLKGYREYADNPYRLEGRITSNNYGFDPYLNLLIPLIGIARGIDPQVLLKRAINPNLILGGSYTNWQSAVTNFTTDEVMAPEFSSQVLVSNMASILRHYPSISQGDITLEEARNNAYQLVRTRG